MNASDPLFQECSYSLRGKIVVPQSSANHKRIKQHTKHTDTTEGPNYDDAAKSVHFGIYPN